MSTEQLVFWHRALPPIDAVVMSEHTVEANSNRVAGTIAHRSELWDRCYREMMATAETRIATEVARLGGRYAHVRSESIGAKHDDAAGEAWLHGTFTYIAYGSGTAVPSDQPVGKGLDHVHTGLPGATPCGPTIRSETQRPNGR